MGDLKSPATLAVPAGGDPAGASIGRQFFT